MLAVVVLLRTLHPLKSASVVCVIAAFEGVAVGVFVGVAVGVFVGVFVGPVVGVFVGVFVAVAVAVGVAVGGALELTLKVRCAVVAVVGIMPRYWITSRLATLS